MKTDSVTADLNMPRRSLHTVPGRMALRLTCREGSVWVTRDHDLQDVVLQPGEVFTTDANHRTIVYALQASVVRMEPLACTRRAKAPRWRGWLHPLSRRGALAAA